MKVRTLESPEPLRDRLFVVVLIVMAVAMSNDVVARYLATEQATAAITEVRPFCEKVTCAWGKCNQRQRINCEMAEQLRSTDSHIQRGLNRESAYTVVDQEARLVFLGSDGAERTTWAAVRKIGMAGARVGDSIAIHYIDGSTPQVVPPPSLFLTIVSIVVLFAIVKYGRGLAQRFAASRR